MATITLRVLSEARDQFDQIINNLKSRHEGNLIYQEKQENGVSRRPIFLLRNQSELDDVKETIAELELLSQDIRKMAGYSVRLPLPTLERSVLLYRIWEHTINASATTSRDEIVRKIQRRLIAARRNSNVTNDLMVEQLQKELDFFMAEKEETYRTRSIGSNVTYVGLSKTGGIDARIKPNDAGTFLVGADFIAPHGETPKHKKPRKQRVTIFDGIEPVPYSGAANALLYRETEVNARKKAVGFNQDKQEAVKNSNKARKTKRDKS